MSNNKELHFLNFGHRKLNKKARDYRHEIQHLTRDMLEVVRKTYKSLTICEGAIKILGSKKQSFRINYDVVFDTYFDDLLYHLENFTFRLYAYRDKLCTFINYVMKLGYSETDEGLLQKLIANTQVQQHHLDTELRKFQSNEFSELLYTRKLMTHKVYYDHYNPYFMPDVKPKDVGYYKAALAWRKKIKKEVEKTNNCMESIFDTNENIAEKLLNYLN